MIEKGHTNLLRRITETQASVEREKRKPLKVE